MSLVNFKEFVVQRTNNLLLYYTGDYFSETSMKWHIWCWQFELSLVQSKIIQGKTGP